MTEKSKRRIDELRYNLERNNFLLSILTHRVLLCLYADGVGEPDSQTSILAPGKISPQYVALIRSIRERFPNDSAEDLAQELYNMIYIEDNGYKRDYSHFQKFDEDLLNEWHILREKIERLKTERVNLDSILSDAKHAYYSVHGKDIEWKEIEEKSEQLEKEIEPETKPETEMDREEWEYTKEMIADIHRKEIEGALLVKMYREGTIDEKTVLEYLDMSDAEHDTFLRIVDMFIEKEEAE